MDKYKHLLLWSTLLLSFFQVTNVQAAEERNPIYNPTNPTEEIYPIENTGTPEKMEETNESTMTSETQAEESSEDVSKKEVTTNNPKTNEERPSSKKSQHQVFFTDELFDASHITIVPNSTGGAGTEGRAAAGRRRHAGKRGRLSGGGSLPCDCDFLCIPGRKHSV